MMRKRPDYKKTAAAFRRRAAKISLQIERLSLMRITLEVAAAKLEMAPQIGRQVRAASTPLRRKLVRLEKLLKQ